MNEFMSIREFMADLKFSRSTVYKHLREGDLISYRIGRLVRITRGDLVDFVKQNRSNCRRLSRRAFQGENFA
jgi:excisionase family DNA binding protein